MKTKLILMYLCFATLTFSCGARKAETSKKEEKIEKTVDAKQDYSDASIKDKVEETKSSISNNIVSNVESKQESSTVVIEPIDLSKESTYVSPDGKKHVFKNAKISNTNTIKAEKNSKDNKYISNKLKTEKTKVNNNIKGSSKIVSLEKNNSNQENRKVDRDEFSNWNFLLIIIPLVLMFVAYNVYKKINKVKDEIL